jgi:hypothetical protein
VVTALWEGWAKGWAVVGLTEMHFPPPIFWAVAEQGEGHVWRCHLMNRYSADSESQH